MDNDQAQKLLGYLYKIVPEKKSATEISKEVFSNAPIHEMVSELLREGYVYQWKNDLEDTVPFPPQELYGITVKGILFFGKFSANKKPDTPFEPLPVVEKMPAPAETKTEPVKKENISFLRV